MNPMGSTMYDNNEDYEVRDATPQRRRRSQPSLEVRPYPGTRPSPPNGHAMSDEVQSQSYNPVKMEPHPNNGSNNGMFANFQNFLPALESTQPSSNNGQAYYPQTSMQSFEPVNTAPVCILRPAAEFLAAAPAGMEAALGFDRYDSNFLPLTQYHGGNGNLVSLAPDHTQLPSTEDFTDILNEYINDLSPKKQDKALIPQKRLNNIEAVLRDPKCTTIESAQFRFWAKKMFTLQVDESGVERVMHENKPVAVREKLYRVLTTAHIQAQHGGRDKTSSQVRKSYSWVPKELIARFVRSCPNCRARRCPAQNRGYTSRARTTPPRAGVTVSSIGMHAHRVQHSLTVQNAQNPQTASHFAYSDPVSMQHPGNQYGQWAQ